jgi:hypothetical protein
MDEETKQEFEKVWKKIKELKGEETGEIEDKEIEEEWYKQGSTIDKILKLDKEHFFNTPKTISEIIKELKSKDYHLKASDLTLPLRKIVRKNILKKTKENQDGSESKNWMYKR